MSTGVQAMGEKETCVWLRWYCCTLLWQRHFTSRESYTCGEVGSSMLHECLWNWCLVKRQEYKYTYATPFVCLCKTLNKDPLLWFTGDGPYRSPG